MNFYAAQSRLKRLPTTIRTKALALGWLRFFTYFTAFVINPVALVSKAPFVFFGCASVVIAVVTFTAFLLVPTTGTGKYLFAVILSIADGFSYSEYWWAAAMVLSAVYMHWFYKTLFRELERQIPVKVSRKKKGKR
jgi:hypothetical protein